MADTKTAARRILRANRLTAELGHADILDALQHAVEMRSALRVIYTWAGVPGALDAERVRELCWRHAAPPNTQEKD